MGGEASRDSSEVFNDHLQLAQDGLFEEDIKKNYSPDCIVLTSRGAFCGFAGLLQLARMLEQEIPNARYCYNNRLVNGRVAFLEWTADCGDVAVHDGTDTFVIENGKIVAQTIHYSLTVRDPSRWIQGK